MPLDDSFKFAKAFDRDGDGLVYDGTPRQRVARADERARHLGLMDRPMPHRSPSAHRPVRPTPAGKAPTKPVTVKRQKDSPVVPKPRYLNKQQAARYRKSYIENLQPGQEIEVWRNKTDERGNRLIESLNVDYVGVKDENYIIVRAWKKDGTHVDLTVKKYAVLVPGAVLKSEPLWSRIIKIKRVRTPEGSRYYNAPIGTPITAAMKVAAKRSGRKPPGAHRAGAIRQAGNQNRAGRGARPTAHKGPGQGQARHPKAHGLLQEINAAKNDQDIERIARKIGSGKGLTDDEYNDLMDKLEARLDKIEAGDLTPAPRKVPAKKVPAKPNTRQQALVERDKNAADLQERIEAAKDRQALKDLVVEAEDLRQRGKLGNEDYKEIREAINAKDDALKGGSGNPKKADELLDRIKNGDDHNDRYRALQEADAAYGKGEISREDLQNIEDAYRAKRRELQEADLNEERERDKYIARIKQAKDQREAERIEDEAAGKFKDQNYKQIMEARKQRVRELNDSSHQDLVKHFDGDGGIHDAPQVGLMEFLKSNPDRFEFKSLDEHKAESGDDDKAGEGLSGLEVVVDKQTGDTFIAKYSTGYEMRADYIREQLANEVARSLGLTTVRSNVGLPPTSNPRGQAVYFTEDAVQALAGGKGELVNVNGLRGAGESDTQIAKDEILKRVALDAEGGQKLVNMMFFDFLIGNTSDRHPGNAFFIDKPDGSLEPILLDHGLAFGGRYGGTEGVYHEDMAVDDFDHWAEKMYRAVWGGWEWNINDYLDTAFEGDEDGFDTAISQSLATVTKLKLDSVKASFERVMANVPDDEKVHFEAYYQLMQKRLAVLTKMAQEFA